MSSSPLSNTINSNNNNAGTPRIQISLSKQQRKNTSVISPGTTTTTTTAVSPNNSSNNNVNNNMNNMISANPVLYKSVRKALKNQTLNFKINVECKYTCL